MSKMPKKTLVALKASIKKYEAYLGAEHPDEIILGPGNCPLCNLFYMAPDAWCVGCPIFEWTLKEACEGTPYEELVDAHDNWERNATAEAKDKVMVAVAKELAFLKILYPSNAKPLDGFVPFEYE